MDSNRYAKLEELFDAVRAVSRADRDATIRRLTGEDTELQDEIRELLAESDKLESPLDTPAFGQEFRLEGIADGDSDEHPLIGQRVGHYQVLSLMGVGGMGTVFEAVQDYPQRTVALKVMNTGIATRQAKRRFEFEVQVLGRLHHPGIAQIYDAGTHTTDGGTPVPYFAMEYVQGAKSTLDYANDHQLGLRQRIELFASVCEAVHAGHQHGVIHRDLKPSNILVDADGQAKIIDFGIAKTTDSDLTLTTLQTETGRMMGTIAYMSPEQFEADPHAIDTRTDVYSLGVVLYELILGELPYEIPRDNPITAASIVLSSDPRQPSSLNREVRGDVETILLKAIARDRESRYQSASGFAGDLRRYLRGDPILARPPTSFERAIRTVSRHPVVTTAIACVSIGLIIIGVTFASAWWLNLRPWKIGPSSLPNSEAWLESYLGVHLREWRAAPGGAIRFADFVRTEGLNGGVVLIAGVLQAPDDRLDGQLGVWMLPANPEDLLWKTSESLTAPARPKIDQVRPMEPSGFYVKEAVVADVFPNYPVDSPAPEIIVVHSHTRSPTAIRVYDLKGRQLYECWHDGTLDRPEWIAGAGIIACTGLSSEPDWDGPRPSEESDRYPTMAFGIRPIIETSHGWIHGGLKDPEAEVVFYRWLLFDGEAVYGDIGLRLDPPKEQPRRGVSADVVASVGQPESTDILRWRLAKNGEPISDAKIEDAFRRVRPEESPESYTLGEPPRVYGSK